MRIKITPEDPGQGSITVADADILKAYEEGGMTAVQELACSVADALTETPFWWPQLTEGDIEALKEGLKA